MQSFEISNFIYQNDSPINIMQNAISAPVLLLFLLGFYVKLYEGTINFQYIFLQFISESRIFSSFMILNLLVLKWWPLYIAQSLKKVILFNVLTKLLLKTL